MASLVICLFLLLVPAGFVVLRTALIVLFEVGDRGSALLALLVAGLGVGCGVAAMVSGSRGGVHRAALLMAVAFVVVGGAVAGSMAIPTHGE